MSMATFVMRKRFKRYCLKYVGTLLLLGIITCGLTAFAGPYFTNVGLVSGLKKQTFVRAHQTTNRLIPAAIVRYNNGTRTIQKNMPEPNLNRTHSQEPTKLSINVTKQNQSQNISKLAIECKNSSVHNWTDNSKAAPTNKTMPHRETYLDDIFIGVKTGGVYHKERVGLLLETWVRQTRNQTYFFTDQDDEEYERKTNGHLINTHCESGHSRTALCCKMGAIFDAFMDQEKLWFCHVDDDNYLNPKQLLSRLQEYDPEEQDIYIGGCRLQKQIETNDKERPGQKFKFRFATGGAGFCISRSLAIKMEPYARNGRFMRVCERIRWPDDMAIGFLIEVLLNTSLIKEDRFNSHIQALGNIRQDLLPEQITLSYKYSEAKGYSNTVYLQKGVFNDTYDPTRLRSLHCMLYPDVTGCPKRDEITS